MSEEFTVAKYFMEVAGEALRFHLGEVLFLGAATSATYLYGAYKTARAIHSGKLKGAVAKIQTTHYPPTVKFNPETKQFERVINPDTGRGYFDQKIRVEEKPVPIREIFNAEVAARIEKYIDKAKEHCTETEPLVLRHLPKVMKSRDVQDVTNLISGEWKGYFSGLYRDTKKMLSTKVGENQFHHEDTILPALIWEEGALGGQYRILLLTLNERGSIDLPPFRDVLFKMQDGSFQHNTESFQDDRYYALKEIKSFLETDEGQAFVKKYSVAIPSGRIVDIGLSDRGGSIYPVSRPAIF